MRTLHIALTVALTACSTKIGAGPGGGTGTGVDGAPSSEIDAPPGPGVADAAPTASATRVVAYLPNYSGSFADWAGSIDFAKMTHLNLAFATVNGNNAWSLGASDGEIAALVQAAHGHGVKVLASLGGGGGDQSVIARFKDAGNIGALVDSLDGFVAAHDLDGVDVDIEDGNNLGNNYSMFVGQTVAKLRPEGKLVTAAVAQYLQDAMSDDTLRSFDFINVMIYSSYNASVDEMNYYTGTKGLPAKQVTLGAAFFGADNGGQEYGFKDILDADPNAWMNDSANVNGRTVNYTGVASMKKLAAYAKGFGGIMFWELSEDTTGEHSLYKAIQESI